MTAARGMASARNRRVAAPDLPAQGFTLIELMVVVAVVAILAAIAVPAYGDQVRKARRGQAKADLVELTQLLERRHTVLHSYEGALPFEASPKEAGATQRYAITPNPIPDDAQTYTLTATPVGDQLKDRCGTLTISHTGVKTATGPAPLSECW